MLAAALLEEFGDEPRPARLVAGADAGAVVAMEVLVEEDEVLPVRILLEGLEAPVHWTPAVGAAEEDRRQPARQLGGDIPEPMRVPEPVGNSTVN